MTGAKYNLPIQARLQHYVRKKIENSHKLSVIDKEIEEKLFSPDLWSDTTGGDRVPLSRLGAS